MLASLGLIIAGLKRCEGDELPRYLCRIFLDLTWGDVTEVCWKVLHIALLMTSFNGLHMYSFEVCQVKALTLHVCSVTFCYTWPCPQPAFDLPRQQWSLLNHFRMEQGHCSACRRKWRLTDLCPCGETQMMFHIVESCPLTKLNGSLSRLHSADEDAVSWLTNYGSWHAYEKKKMSSSLAVVVSVLISRCFCQRSQCWQ